MTATLITAYDGDEKLCEFQRRDDRVELTFSQPDVRHDLERWQHGLTSFLGAPGQRRVIIARADHPELIELIAHRLAGYGFRVERTG